MIKHNYLIINKKPYAFSEMRMAGRTAVFLNENGRPIDYGVLAIDDSVYTVMNCDRFRIVMMVIEEAAGSRVEGMIWTTDAGYEHCLSAIKAVSGRKVYHQDFKICNYARQIAAKLADGVRVSVTEAVDESGMTVCPECGMLNPKGTPYCLECGADL